MDLSIHKDDLWSLFKIRNSEPHLYFSRFGATSGSPFSLGNPGDAHAGGDRLNFEKHCPTVSNPRFALISTAMVLDLVTDRTLKKVGQIT
jgi:hypothetical protein